MKPSRVVAIALVCLVAGGLRAGEPSSADVRSVIARHPEIILDFLREHRSEVLRIVSDAADENEERQRVEKEKAAQKELDEAFAQPKIAAIGDDTPVRGRRNARYTLVEYSDFQCPFCVRGFQTVEELRKLYGDELRVVYKHVPLTAVHPQAMPAALYFEAVALQAPEKVWSFHDRLFQNQDKLGEDFYRATARELGLDLGRLERDVRSDAVRRRVDDDVAEAARFGFSGTPGFLLNGIPIRGAYSVDYFKSIVARLSARDGGKEATR